MYYYANKEGYYPVLRNNVVGGFTKENIAKENSQGVREIIINTHGQWNNIDQTIFQNSSFESEQRESFLHIDDINLYLDEYAYYLNMWSCSNAYDLQNNIIQEALLGNCVGAFAATTVISNNGANNRASYSAMKNNNFYYFYYIYLKALNSNSSRSEAFFLAQKAYGEALSANSNQLNYMANYQFNMYNLLAYHNLGVFESSAFSVASVSCDPNFDISFLGEGALTEEFVGEKIILKFDASLDNSAPYEVVQITAQKTSFGRIILEVTVKDAYRGLSVCAFNPPNGDLFKVISAFKNGNVTTIILDCEPILKTDFLVLSVYIPSPSETAYFVITNSSLNALKEMTKK